MIKYIICEDKERDLERAKLTINRAMMDYNVDYRIYCYDDFTKEVRQHIKSKEGIKVFILDVELKKTSGIEIGSVIRETDWESYIVYVTSHAEFKHDVFHARLLAFDYISKYNTYECRLKDTIKKIVEKEQNYQVLHVTFNRNLHSIQLNKIVYLEKENSGFKTIIHLENGDEIAVVETLKSLEKRLSTTFFRTHQSAIVNLEFFQTFDYDNDTIIFKNGMSTNLLALKNKKRFKELVKCDKLR